MATAEREVDDSFLNEVDDSFLDEVDEPAPKQVQAANKWNDNPVITKILDDYRKNNESNEALLAAFSLIPTMGFRKQLGQAGAAVMDKAMGSELPLGDLYDRARPQIEDYYRKKAETHPLETAAGTVIGGLPVALALNPLSASAASSALPMFAKKLATAGALGLESGALSGVVGFNDSDETGFEGKGYDALSQAILGTAMGTGGSLLPEAITSTVGLAKRGAGKLAKAPAQARDAIAEMLGGGVKPSAPSRADDFAQQMSDLLPKPIEAVPDNVTPIRQDDIETKITPIRNFLRDADGTMYLGGKKPKFKSKKEAFQKIAEASGVDDFSKQSVEAGHFDEIERLVGRKVKSTEDAFDALVAASAKKRGKKHGTRDWEDVQTAIRELKKLDGLEDLQLPADVQDAILPIEDEPSFNFGFNEKPAPAKDPDFLRKSQELADMLDESADTVISPVDMKPSIHENLPPSQIHQGEQFASELGLAPDAPVGAGQLKHKGFYRGQQHRFPTDRNERMPGAGEWAPGEWENATQPKGGFDWFSEANDDAINQILNRGEFGRARQRWALDVDSSVGRVAKPAKAPAVSEMAGEKTGQGAKPLYEPMGVQAAAREPMYPDTQRTQKIDWYDQLERMGIRRPDAPMTDDFFAQIEAQVNAQGAQNLQDVPWQRSALKSREPIDVPGLGEFVDDEVTSITRPPMRQDAPIDVPGWTPPQRLPSGPTPEQIAARTAGREKMEQLGGVLGGAAGAVHSGPVGAWAGYKAGPGAVKNANAVIDKMAGAGAKLDRSPEQMAKQMASNPAMLQQIASSGGPLASAAKFILQGAEEAGDIGLKARAFVAAAMPSMRELFVSDRP